MSTPKRYVPDNKQVRMIESFRGEWVRWEDYCETVRRLVEGESVQCSACKRSVPPDAEWCCYCGVAFGGRFALTSA